MLPRTRNFCVGEIPVARLLLCFYLLPKPAPAILRSRLFGNHRNRWSQGRSLGRVSAGRICPYRCHARMLQPGCKRLWRELYVHLNEVFSLNQVFSFSHVNGIDFILITSQPSRCRDLSDFYVGLCLTSALPFSLLKGVLLAGIFRFFARVTVWLKATNGPLLTLDYG